MAELQQLRTTAEELTQEILTSYSYPAPEQTNDADQGRADADNDLVDRSADAHSFGENVVLETQSKYQILRGKSEEVVDDVNNYIQIAKGQKQTQQNTVKMNKVQESEEIESVRSAVGEKSASYLKMAQERGMAEAKLTALQGRLNRPSQAKLPLLWYLTGLSLVVVSEAPINYPAFTLITDSNRISVLTAVLFGAMIAGAAHLVGDLIRRTSHVGDDGRKHNLWRWVSIYSLTFALFAVFYLMAGLRKLQFTMKRQNQEHQLFDPIQTPDGIGLYGGGYFLTSDWFQPTAQLLIVFGISTLIYFFGVFLSFMAHDSVPHLVAFDRKIRSLDRQMESKRNKSKSKIAQIKKNYQTKAQALDEEIKVITNQLNQANTLRDNMRKNFLDQLLAVAINYSMQRITNYQHGYQQSRPNSIPNSFHAYTRSKIESVLKKYGSGAGLGAPMSSDVDHGEIDEDDPHSDESSGRSVVAGCLALLTSVLISASVYAQGNDYKQYGEQTVLLFIDQTTNVDDTDLDTLRSGLAKLYEETLSSGDRFIIQSITDDPNTSEALHSFYFAECPDGNIFWHLWTECITIKANTERREQESAIGKLLKEIQESDTSYPSSAISQTVARVTRLYSTGVKSEASKPVTEVWIHSDLIEHSDILPSTSLFSMSTEKVLEIMRENRTIPSVQDANVMVFGCGRSHGKDRVNLTQAELVKLSEIWKQLFTEGGASNFVADCY